MGQYHKIVNLDKREYLHPHKLGCGLKLGEQLGTYPGTCQALLILLACSNGRGGGDLYRPAKPGEDGKLEDYTPDPLAGRWAGDRIAVVGDYAEAGDLPHGINAKDVYHLCDTDTENPYTVGCTKFEAWERAGYTEADLFTDISAEVAAALEYHFRGKYTGDGWLDWQPDKHGEQGRQVLAPDFAITRN